MLGSNITASFTAGQVYCSSDKVKWELTTVIIWSPIVQRCYCLPRPLWRLSFVNLNIVKSTRQNLQSYNKSMVRFRPIFCLLAGCWVEWLLCFFLYLTTIRNIKCTKGWLTELTYCWQKISVAQHFPFMSWHESVVYCVQSVCDYAAEVWDHWELHQDWS